MRCELCGKTVFEKIFAEVEGKRSMVCQECAGAFGRDIKSFDDERPSISRQGLEREKAAKKPVLDEGLDLSEDFGKRISAKRQKIGLTVEELARKIFEKESTLHKIEAQKLIPSDSLVSKLEKALSVSLREKPED